MGTRNLGPITGGSRQVFQVANLSWFVQGFVSFSTKSSISWESAAPTSVPGQLQ